MQMQLDDIETIQLINYIRKAQTQGYDTQRELAICLANNIRPWKADKWMHPVMENDSYLLHDWEGNILDSPLPPEGSMYAPFLFP